jgi:hypothetical protein
MEEKTIVIHWSRTKAEGPDEFEDETAVPENHNTTTVVYTGIKGAELGFLNVGGGSIELYDIGTGFMTKRLELPYDAPSQTTFNFAYANGIYWLFDMDSRTWTGYK